MSSRGDVRVIFLKLANLSTKLFQILLSCSLYCYRSQQRNHSMLLLASVPSIFRHSFIRISRRYFPGIPHNLNLKEGSAISQTLRGCGQVVFLGDASQGATVLAGLAIGDPTLAAFAFGGGAWCTALSRVMLNEGDEPTNNGLHAYNGVLVGAAFSVFLGPNPLTIAGATIVGSTGTFALSRVLGAYYPFGPQWTFAFNAVAIGGLMTSNLVAPVSIMKPAVDDIVVERPRIVRSHVLTFDWSISNISGQFIHLWCRPPWSHCHIVTTGSDTCRNRSRDWHWSRSCHRCRLRYNRSWSLGFQSMPYLVECGHFLPNLVCWSIGLVYWRCCLYGTIIKFYRSYCHEYIWNTSLYSALLFRGHGYVWNW